MGMKEVRKVLDRRQSEWKGRKLSSDETKSLHSEFGPVANEQWLELLGEFPLVGTDLGLTRAQDPTGRRVDAKVMGPKSMRQEADGYPGKLAVKVGFFPFAWCLLGSGDPYFLKFESTWKVVRILHDACNVKAGTINPDGIETILPLAKFLALARVV